MSYHTLHVSQKPRDNMVMATFKFYFEEAGMFITGQQTVAPLGCNNVLYLQGQAFMSKNDQLNYKVNENIGYS